MINIPTFIFLAIIIFLIGYSLGHWLLKQRLLIKLAETFEEMNSKTLDPGDRLVLHGMLKLAKIIDKVLGV